MLPRPCHPHNLTALRLLPVTKPWAQGPFRSSVAQLLPAPEPPQTLFPGAVFSVVFQLSAKLSLLRDVTCHPQLNQAPFVTQGSMHVFVLALMA